MKKYTCLLKGECQCGTSGTTPITNREPFSPDMTWCQFIEGAEYDSYGIRAMRCYYANEVNDHRNYLPPFKEMP